MILLRNALHPAGVPGSVLVATFTHNLALESPSRNNYIAAAEEEDAEEGKSTQGKLAWTKNVDTSSEERRVIRLLAPLDGKSVRTMPNRSESRPCSEESIECKGMYKLHGVPQPYHAACQTGIQLRYTSLAQPYTKHR